MAQGRQASMSDMLLELVLHLKPLSSLYRSDKQLQLTHGCQKPPAAGRWSSPRSR